MAVEPMAFLAGGAVLAFGVSAWLAWLAWRRRPRLGASSFAWVMGLNAVWIALYGLAIVAPPADTPRWFLASKVVTVLVPVVWLRFALAYAGRSTGRIRRVTVAAAVPAVAAAALIATNPLHRLVFDSVEVTPVLGAAVPVPAYGPGVLFSLGYAVVVLGASFAVLGNVLFGVGRLHRTQVGLLVVGAGLPTATTALYVLGLGPVPAVDLTPYAVVAEGVVLFGALYGFGLFDLSPVARSALFEELGSPAVVVDDDGRIVDANAAARNLAAGEAGVDDTRPPREIVGDRFADVFPSVADRDSDVAMIDGRYYDCRRHRLDGRLHGSGSLLVLSDVTDHRRRQASLESLQAASRELITAESVGEVCDTTVDAAERTLDREYAVVYLREGDTLRPAAYTDATEDLLDRLPELPIDARPAGEAVRRGETVVVADPAAFDDGENCSVIDGNVSVEVVGADAYDELFGWIDDDPSIPDGGAFVPIADRGVLAVGLSADAALDDEGLHFAELLATTAAASLARAEREAELADHNERLEELGSVLNHDLRNPLAVARGNLDLARDEVGEVEELDKVADALDRIDELTADLLSLARDDRQEFSREPVSVDAVAREAWGTTLTGDATLEVEDDRRLLADRGRLRQLFENLFRNAIEHGGADTVTVGTVDDGFYVEDDGDGIPASLDDPFERGVSGDDGTGIGLSVVAEVAREHDLTPRLTYGNGRSPSTDTAVRGDDGGVDGDHATDADGIGDAPTADDGAGGGGTDPAGGCSRGARFEFVVE